MLNSNETYVKDIEFKKFDESELIDIIKEYRNVYNRKNHKNKIIILVEIVSLLILTVLDFCKINVSLLLLILCIVLFGQYLLWGFRKINKMSKHFDVKSFLKDVEKDFSYIEVICDDIAKESDDIYVTLLSTIDNINIMEKIYMPYIDKMSVKFDRKEDAKKPRIYMVKAGITYFAIESIDASWWRENIQNILK